MYAANDYSRLETDIRGSTEAVVARSHQAAVQIRLVGEAGIERFPVRIFDLAGVALLWTTGRLLSIRCSRNGFFRHAATAKDSDQQQTPRILSHDLTLAPCLDRLSPKAGTVGTVGRKKQPRAGKGRTTTISAAAGELCRFASAAREDPAPGGEKPVSICGTARTCRASSP